MEEPSYGERIRPHFRRKKHEQPLYFLPSVDAATHTVRNDARPFGRSPTPFWTAAAGHQEGRLTDSGQLGLDALLPRLAASRKKGAHRASAACSTPPFVIHTNMPLVLADGP
ncbi:MAG: hypothetical protein ACLSAH_10660 [Bilophila wadsworthia]